MSKLITAIIIILVIVVITSTQKVQVNNKQIATASPSTCSLIKESYDTINKICTGTIQNANKTVQG